MLAGYLILMQACEPPDLSDKNLSTNDPLNTVLDKNPRANPFTSENMKQALKNVVGRITAKGGRIAACWADCIPSTTHNYVRFAPQNVDQLITLHNYGYDLYDVPLDVEVTTQGEYYQDPSLPADAITYQYTLVPDNYILPTTVPYVILSTVFLFDETAGDEADEPDPWVPNPSICGEQIVCYCYDEWGQLILCESSPITIRKNEALPEDLYKKATQTLIDAGIDLRELYNEAMRLAGWDEEIIPDAASGGRVANYIPSGTVRVRDNVTGLDVPVKNLTVKTRRFFKLDEALTDVNGNFVISKSYRAKAHVVLKFKTPGMKIRGISDLLKVWEYAQVLERELGLFEGSQLVGMSINIPYHSNADTHNALAWAGAHCLNTYYESKQYSTANSITVPYYGMNVWISSAITQSASTPMLRAIANTSLVSQALDYLLPSIASMVKQIVQNFLPDVTLRLQASNGSTRNAADLTNTFFHEFGHSQHYSVVGNNFWAAEIGYTIANGGYGNKTTSGSGRAAVVESWGFFIGNTFNETKYRAVGNGLATTRADQELFELENQIPGDNDWWQWIPYGAIHDMRDVGEPAFTTVIDNVSGYSIQGLFSGYQPGITTVQELRQEILNRNGNSQATQVNQLITSYRW